MTNSATSAVSATSPNELVTLTQAAKLAPGRPSTNAMWRWCRKGIQSRGGDRIRLEHVRLGGRVYTRADWIIAFGKKLAEADAAHFDARAGGGASTDQPVPASARRAHLDQIERELAEEGL
jgi:hypothetical protein